MKTKYGNELHCVSWADTGSPYIHITLTSQSGKLTVNVLPDEAARFIVELTGQIKRSRKMGRR